MFIWALTFVVVVICAVDHLKGRLDGLSIRNTALVGFLIFMVQSAKVGLHYDIRTTYNLSDPHATVFEWLGWCALFLLVFFPVYRIGFGARSVASILPMPKATIGLTSAWPLMVCLTVMAFGLKAVPIPLVAALAGMTATGLASVAAGIAGWVWGPRLFNPIIAVPASFIVLANIFVANWGEFGRRPMVSVGAGLIWGMYYSAFRYLPLPSMAARIALVAIPPVMVFGAYSSVRSWKTVGTTEVIRDMVSQGDATSTLDELGEQDTARVGQWLMEYYDRGGYETRFLFTVQYFFMFPVPRELFEVVGFEKPWPISTQMADLSNRKGVKLGNTGVTNPAGIIGNASVEGGFIAIVVYAALGAFIFRVSDEYIRRGAHSAFLVLPIGASLGQVMGIARGESSTFMFHFLWTTFSVTVIMTSFSAVLSKLFPQLGADEADAFGGTLEGDDAYDDSGYYLYDHESANESYTWYDETEHTPDSRS